MTDPTKSTTNKGIDTSRAEPLDLTVINDEQAGVYGAFVGDREIAGLPYTVAGPDRLVLLATSVFPEFRHRGVGTELVRRALDDIRTRGKTVTVMCPIVRSFVDDNPRYADLIDAQHPGVTRPR